MKWLYTIPIKFNCLTCRINLIVACYTAKSSFISNLNELKMIFEKVDHSFWLCTEDLSRRNPRDVIKKKKIRCLISFFFFTSADSAIVSKVRRSEVASRFSKPDRPNWKCRTWPDGTDVFSQRVSRHRNVVRWVGGTRDDAHSRVASPK